MRVHASIIANGALLIGLTAAGSLLALPADAGKPERNTLTVCKSERHDRCDYNTIQAAIYDAAPGTRIRVGRGTYEENLVIENKSLEIIGESPRRTTIDADEPGSTISLRCSPSYPVKIANVTISGGSSSTAGGGVSNDKCDLTLFDTVVSGNAVVGGATLANAFGGGIANLVGSKLTLRDTTVTYNRIEGPNTVALGAGIYNAGRLLIWDSAVTGNKAAPSASAVFFRAQGGGIFNTMDGDVIVNDSTVTNNTTKGAGGGVPSGGGIEDAGGSVKVFGSNIARNSAGNGGGIYMVGDVLLKGSSVRRNLASLKGGGVYVTAVGALTVKSSNINRNAAGSIVGSGGGIFSEVGATVDAIRETIRANTPDNCAGAFSC